MLNNWLSNVFAHTNPRKKAKATRRRGRVPSTTALESLEQRTLLTAYLVDTIDDSAVADGMLSLREAIEAANTNAPFLDALAGEIGPGTADTISFAPALNGMTITLNGSALTISDDLTITDTNAAGITIDADRGSRVFEIADGANSVSISNITITGGRATSGGGVLIDAGETLSLTNVTVDGNTATSLLATEGGAGIATAGGTLNISESTISNNTTVGSSVTVLSGDQEVPAVTTSATGTADFQFDPNTRTFDLDLFVSGMALADVSGAHIHAAAAGTNGPVIVNLTNLGSFVEESGGIRLELNDVAFPAAHVQALLSSGTYFNVHSSAQPGGEVRGQITYAATASSGGGILSNQGTVTVSNSFITGNTASRAGGGIETVAGSLTLTNVTLNDNVAGPAGFVSPGNGGGLHVTGAGSVDITGGTVQGNIAAAEGGGLWNGTGTMTITGNTLITENTANGTAADQGGAGVFNAGGTVNIDGATISNNTTVGSTVVTLSGDQEVPAVTTASTGTANLQYNPGTGTFELDLFVTGIALADITGAHIHAAAAGANGPVIVNLTNIGSFVAEAGGIRLVLGDVDFPATNVEALFSGETYFNVHSTANPGGELRGQIMYAATSGSGGGILNDQGTLAVSNASITGNTASRAGGGIETVAGSVTLTGVNLDNNIAGPAGAANPGNGGGLHTSGAGVVTINGGTVSGNTAGSEGGGLWNSVAGTLTVNGTTIDGNTAVEGGGIFNDATDGTATQQFSLNITELNGSGVTGTGSVTVTQPTATTREVRVVINAAGMEDLTSFGGFHVAHIHGQFAGNRTRPLLQQGNGPFFTGAGGTANGFPPVNSILPSVAANDGATISDGFLDFLEGRPQYGPVLLNLTSTQLRDAGTHGTNPPDGVPPLAHFLNLLTAGEIDPTMLFPQGTDFVLDTIYTFDLTNADEARQFHNLAPLDLREIVIHGASIDKAISDAIDAAAMGTAPGGTDLDNGLAFRVTAPVAAAEIVAVSGSVNISNATISNNTATGDGGGLYNETGAASIVDTNITGNVSGGDAPGEGGGGIFNEGTLEVTGGTISNNTAIVGLGNGGGIHNAASGTVTVIDTNISGNDAARAGGGIESAGTLELTNVALTRNVASINGGGLHVSGPGTTAIVGGTVSGNIAQAEGGGLWNGTGTMTITGNTLITENTANGTAADQGGAGVFNAGGTVNIDGATISNNATIGSTVVALSGDQEVPAVTTTSTGTADLQYNPGTGTFDLDLFVTGIALADITGAHIHAAAAGANGPVIVNLTNLGSFVAESGGIRLVLEDVALPAQHAATLLSGGTYFNVHSTANAGGEVRGQITYAATSGSGGGILNDQGTLTVSNASITGNTASRAGGGIETVAGLVTLTNVTLDSNVAGPVGATNPGNGGGLHVTGAGSVDVSGGTVSNNTAASEGGGLWNGTGVMTITGGTVITANVASGTAADQGGGGIFNAGGTVNVDGASITNNTTVGSTVVGLSGDQEVPVVTTSATGRADFRFNPGAGTFDLDLFVAGIALADITGAHIHVGATGSNGPVVVNLTNLTAFVADGGGIRLTLNDAAFPAANAQALLSGGAYFNVHSTANPGGEVRGQITFAATSGSGGGILNDQGMLNVTNAMISGNAASRAGGGIETNVGAVAITNSLLAANQGGAFPGNGGGLHITGAGLVAIDNSTISGNTASNEGAGLWNSSAGTLTVRNSTIAANDVLKTAAGGGVFTVSGGTTTLLNTIVAGNVAGPTDSANEFAGPLTAGSNNNLVADAGSSGGLANGSNGNIVGVNGTGTRSLTSILDPNLTGGAGQVPAHALVVGSPAIDAGSDLTTAGITADQNGTARPISTAFDIGAIEASLDVVNGPRVSITQTISVTEGDTAVFTVSLNRNPTETVTVTVTTVDGDAVAGVDYTATTQTLTFQPNSSLTQQFAVQTIEDTVPETPNSFQVQVTSAVGAVILNATGTAQIADNDAVTPPVLDQVTRYPGVRPTLTWQSVPGAASYEVWVGRIFPASQRILASEAAVSGTSYTPGIDLDPAFYRFWVRTVASNGLRSGWSVPNVFEVQPTVVSPTTPGFNRRPTFVWDAIPNTSGYELFIRTSTGDVVLNNLQGTTYTPTTDLPDGPIRWWIRSSDAILNRGYSAPTDFTFQTTVLTPSETTADTTPTVTWLNVDNATRYIVFVQNQETSEVLRDNSLQGTSFTPATPLVAGNYRVWVRAIGPSNVFSDGRWSRPLSFTIAAATQKDDDSSENPSTVLRLASLQLDVGVEEVGDLQPNTDSQPLVHTRPVANETVSEMSTAIAEHSPNPARTSNAEPDGIRADQSIIDDWMANAEELAALLIS